MPEPLLQPLPEVIRSWWMRHEHRWSIWRGVYGLLVAGAALLVIRDAVAVIAVVVLLVAGGVGWLAQSALASDLAYRRERHRRALGPAVGGFRLRGDLRDLDPEAVILADLVATLYDSLRVVARPWRGHRGHRTTYEFPLRNRCRRFAASRSLPVRAGDRYGRRLLELGVLCRVRISQVDAWRLVHRRCPDALRALELALGVRLFDWSIGRDPDA